MQSAHVLPTMHCIPPVHTVVRVTHGFHVIYRPKLIFRLLTKLTYYRNSSSFQYIVAGHNVPSYMICFFCVILEGAVLVITQEVVVGGAACC